MRDYDYRRRRDVRYYDNYRYWPTYNQFQLFNSNYSTVSQIMYNLGYMDGVNQSSIVNQSIGRYY